MAVLRLEAWGGRRADEHCGLDWEPMGADIQYKVLWIGKIAKHKGIGENKGIAELFLYRNSGFRTKMGELIIRNCMVMESEIRRMNDSG